MPELSLSDNARLESWFQQVGATRAFSSLMELPGDWALFVVNENREIIAWSKGAEELLGFSREEVLGQHCLKANRCPECMAGCGISELGEIRGASLTLLNSSGTPVQVRKFAQQLTDEKGEFCGGIEILRPVHAQPSKLRLSPLHNPVEVFHGMITQNDSMRNVFQCIRNVAATDVTVLVRGESGTGKELVARALHAESHRGAGPFVAVNCAALSPNLMESELFGHVKGAFTGAIKDRKGLFQQAKGGTLFLDEIAELPLPMQAKLLRVLEQQTVTPVGAQKEYGTDVRVIAATHRSLRERVRTGHFREDLMFRLRVVPLFIPPLRERPGEVEHLLWDFIDKYNSKGMRTVSRIEPEAMKILLEYPWPGNVRELINVIQYAFAISRSTEISIDELPPEFRERLEAKTPAFLIPKSDPLSTPADDEASRIRQAMQATGNHLGNAARLLGISRPTLWRKRKKFKI